MSDLKYCFDPALLVPGRLLPGYGIVGERPETFTLGFRWSAPDNMFTNAGNVGAEEWKRVHAATNEESAERALRQFTWALPVEDTAVSTLAVSAQAVRRRQGRLGRGLVPEGWRLSSFLDLGQRVCHWGAVAGADRYQVVDTGVIEVPSGDIALEKGLTLAMWQYYDRVLQGWSVGSAATPPAPPVAEGRITAGTAVPHSSGGNVLPGIALVDSGGKWTAVVYQFIKEANAAAKGKVAFFATKGHGLSQDQGKKVYLAPDAVTVKLPYVGDRYHVRLQEANGIYLIHMDADWWKTRVHNGLSVALGEPGSLVLWYDDHNATDIWTLSKHLTAEVGVTEFDPKRGNVTRWERKNPNNHLLDCIYGCLVGQDYLRVIEDARAVRKAVDRAATEATRAPVNTGPFRWNRE